jgi:hypothetical protein
MKNCQIYFQHLGIHTLTYDQGSDRKFRHCQPSYVQRLTPFRWLDLPRLLVLSGKGRNCCDGPH